MAVESFVGRWSRLKRQARPLAESPKQDETREEPAASTAVPCTAAIAAATGSGVSMEAASRSGDLPAWQRSATSSPPGQDGGHGDQPCRTRPLPDIESLGVDSDLSMFMRAEVDPHLRVRALKKLFADPHFNRMDGLDVYVDDYSKPDPMPLAFIRRLDQSRILGLADEPAPDRAVPGEAGVVAPDELADAADKAAASDDPAAGGEAVASATAVGATEPADAANGLDAAGAVQAAAAAEPGTVAEATRAALAVARLDGTG